MSKPAIQTEDYLREMIIILFVRKRIIFRTTYIISLCAVLIAFFWPPTYTVVASILIKGKNLEKRPEALEVAELRMSKISQEDLLSEMELIKSRDVIKSTVNYFQTSNPQLFNEDTTADATKKAVNVIRSNLKTQLVPKTNIIEIKLSGKNPERDLAVLNRLIPEYVLYRNNVFNPVQAVSFFEKEVQRCDGAIRKKERELIDLAEKMGAADPLREIEGNLLIKQTHEELLNLKKNHLIEKQYYVKSLENALSSEGIQFFSFINNLSIDGFAAKLQELIIKKGNLLREFHPESKKIQRIQEQVNETYAMLKADVAVYLRNQESELRILEDTIKSLQTRVITLSKRNINIYTQLVQSERLRNQISLLQYSYDTFSKRLEEAKIVSESNLGKLFAISVIAKPFFSGTADFPQKKKVIPIGIIVGLITGCSFGFLIEFFDHSFKTPEDVAKYTGLPVIFSIPLRKSA